MTPAAGWLLASGAAPAWRGQRSWRVLDTAFGTGDKFVGCVAAWAADTRRPVLLHYVALATEAPGLDSVLAELGRHPALQHIAAELQAQWFGLMPGFHRLHLHAGQVLLTLCFGPTRTMLRGQQCVFDSVLLDDAQAAAWDGWDIGALAGCCQRGTGLATRSGGPAFAQDLAQAGFALHQAPGWSGWQGSYNPCWALKRGGRARRGSETGPGNCIVIGAGLAGASVAAALARRGWPVTVLDRAAQPAAGASGVPVGLCLPHVSADDSPRSRLSRAGVRLAMQQARTMLLQGHDWDASGVLEQRLNGSPGLPGAWGAAAREWSRSAPHMGAGSAWGRDMAAAGATLWHAQAAWIKPERLIAAWLAQPGVRFTPNALVQSLRRIDGQWRLLDANGRELGRASHVVLAAAGASLDLLRQACADPSDGIGDAAQVPALQPIGGRLSWGWHRGASADLPPYPVNGAGSFLAGIPMDQGSAWFAGATYEPPAGIAQGSASGHRENLARLRTLLPQAAAFMEQELLSRRVQGWSGVRHATADRLPLLGPMQGPDGDSLWLCAGMGSRGLALAPLCAELLAAQLCSEPLPVEARLLRLLRACRAKPTRGGRIAHPGLGRRVSNQGLAAACEHTTMLDQAKQDDVP